ncbi:MAG TPA: hypothetical protein VF789_25735 [Thermoanaerobaculia bacterium]
MSHLTGLRLFSAALLVQAALPAAGQPPGTVTEQIVVREREILVDVPGRLEDNRLKPADFQVLVNGRLREVTRVERVADTPWTFLIYIDQTLARPETVFYSTLALADRARDLTRLGTVEVAVAASGPRVALAPTREPRSLRQTLADLAGAARVERDRTEDHGRPADPSPLQVQRHLEKLLAFMASRPAGGPRALFLVMDGADLTPRQIERIERGQARTLSASGWTVLALRLHKQKLDDKEAVVPQTEIGILNQGAAYSDLHNGVPPLILPGQPPSPTTLAFLPVIDLFLQPRNASLRALAQATAGTVIGFEPQLDAMLGALPHRWRIWISEPDEPAAGKLQTLAVSLPRKGGLVRAPAWISWR